MKWVKGWHEFKESDAIEYDVEMKIKIEKETMDKFPEISGVISSIKSAVNGIGFLQVTDIIITKRGR